MVARRADPPRRVGADRGRLLRALLHPRDLDDEPGEAAGGGPLATSAIAALLLAAVGWAADLPGAREAAILGAVLLGAGVVAALVRNGHARALHGYAIGTLLGALALAVSIQASDMRWDYWRNVGGDHRRRGEIEEAYVAYVKANRYAPPDDDRRDEEQQMRRILEQRGVLPREGE